jgi:hypothetical protein
MEPPQPSDEGGAGALLDDVVIFLVHPHVGAVHEFHDLDVAAPGHDPELAPELHPLLGGPLGREDQLAVLLAEFGHDLVGQLLGDDFGGPGLGLVPFAFGEGYVVVPGDLL